MKTRIAVLALAGMVFAVPAFAANMCIDTRDIVSSTSKDGRVMVFKMRDGRTLINHLQGICTDLRFNGFVWKLPPGSNEVCERESNFSVLQSGQNCTLGKFDPVADKQTAK